MPRRHLVPPELIARIDSQDGVIHRDQALELGLPAGAIKARLRDDHWTVLLPQVYLTNTGTPTRCQLLVGALLYCGSDTAIDDVDACWFHGIRAVPAPDNRVFVVAPFGSTARSRRFVVVRRTIAPIITVNTDFVRYLEPAAAVIAASRRMRPRRSVLAALSDAIQRQVTTYDDLVGAHIQGPPRNMLNADDALEQLAAGVRSAPEGQFRQLAQASLVLPEFEYNAWLRLPDKRVVCADALIEGSAVVHETNGRAFHAREDLFEDMQERHDAMTAAGFVVLHSSPAQLSRRGRERIAQVEQCHLRYDGRGLPPGVERIRQPFEAPLGASNGSRQGNL